MPRNRKITGIKMDKNFGFTGYPLWLPWRVPPEDTSPAEYSTKGYSISFHRGVVTRSDYVLFLSLLDFSQKHGWAEEIVTSPSQLCRDSGLYMKRLSLKDYERVGISMTRLAHTIINFDAYFRMEGEKKHRRGTFQLLSWVEAEYERNRTLDIALNQVMLKFVKSSKFFRIVSSYPYRYLKSDLACRAWEMIWSRFRNKGKNSLKSNHSDSECYDRRLVYIGKALGVKSKAVNRPLDPAKVEFQLVPAIQEVNEAHDSPEFIYNMIDSGIPPTDLFKVSMTITGKGKEAEVSFRKMPLSEECHRVALSGAGVKPKSTKKSNKSTPTEVPAPILSSAKPKIELPAEFKFSHLDPEKARDHMRRIFPMMFEIDGLEASALHAHYLELPRDDDGDPINFGIPEAEAFVKSYRKVAR